MATGKEDSFEPEPITDEQWTTVSEERPPETKIDFAWIGDEFIGTYLGQRMVQGAVREFRQYRFKGIDGEFYFAAGASLDDGMRRVRIGSRVRITYIDDQDTGQMSPMKIFKVDVAKTQGR